MGLRVCGSTTVWAFWLAICSTATAAAGKERRVSADRHHTLCSRRSRLAQGTIGAQYYLLVRVRIAAL
jgi:hypothetical protein